MPAAKSVAAAATRAAENEREYRLEQERQCRSGPRIGWSKSEQVELQPRRSRVHWVEPGRAGVSVRAGATVPIGTKDRLEQKRAGSTATQAKPGPTSIFLLSFQ